MSDEPFSAEYFQHLLNSLTLNSRALIVELTGLAEKYVDNANTIVGLIEERIVKILPKYKLFSFYLMDSIVKNVGNPYALLFSKSLYKVFTETYLVVTDTVTRQSLINLFKTWLTGKTSAGLDLFSQDVLQKIEQFVIKATSISSIPDETVRITRDTLLREGNYLLQYVIALDGDLDRFAARNELDDDKKESIKQYHQVRNNLIFDINTISEAAMLESKTDFDSRKDNYATELQRIRRTLDDQSFQQVALFRGTVEAAEEREVEQDLNIEVNLTPKGIDIVFFGGDTTFDSIVQEWGKPLVQEVEPQSEPEIVEDVHLPLPEEPSLASSLGFASFNFMDSFLGSPKNELTPIASMTSLSDVDSLDGDGYVPEETLPEQLTPTKPFNGKSSMKRGMPGEEKAVKRVRFEV